MGREKKNIDYVKELQNSFDRWAYLYQYGCRDPSWSDGVNMNLVRNHICYYKKKIEETIPQHEYPAMYFQDLPPEMPQNYMARADEIRESAKRSLSLYLADENKRFLNKKLITLDKQSIKNTCIINVLNYAKALDTAIRNDDLITMRRHENPEAYIESFARCAEKVKNIRPPINEQLSMFSLTENQNEDDFDDDIDITMQF